MGQESINLKKKWMVWFRGMKNGQMVDIVFRTRAVWQLLKSGH